MIETFSRAFLVYFLLQVEAWLLPPDLCEGNPNIQPLVLTTTTATRTERVLLEWTNNSDPLYGRWRAVSGPPISTLEQDGYRFVCALQPHHVSCHRSNGDTTQALVQLTADGVIFCLSSINRLAAGIGSGSSIHAAPTATDQHKHVQWALEQLISWVNLPPPKVLVQQFDSSRVAHLCAIDPRIRIDCWLQEANWTKIHNCAPPEGSVSGAVLMDVDADSAQPTKRPGWSECNFDSPDMDTWWVDQLAHPTMTPEYTMVVQHEVETNRSAVSDAYTKRIVFSLNSEYQNVPAKVVGLIGDGVGVEVEYDDAWAGVRLPSKLKLSRLQWCLESHATAVCRKPTAAQLKEVQTAVRSRRGKRKQPGDAGQEETLLAND